MADFDDIHYIHLIKNGDINAFTYIVRRYQGMVYNIVCKIVLNKTEAEDITQDIFIKVFRSLDKFRAESGFSTWLYRIAYNTAITQLRKTKRQNIVIDEKAETLPDIEISENIENITTEEQLQYLDIVLKKLAPEDAMLISLFYMNNHSIDEISKITELSQSNIKVKLYRIRKFMNFEINKLMLQ